MGRAVILLATFRFGYPVADQYLIQGGRRMGRAVILLVTFRFGNPVTD